MVMCLFLAATAADMLWLKTPLLEKMLRPAIVYGFLVLMFRIFGKRELAQLNPFDLVVLLSISNTVQNAIIGDDNSVTGGLVGAFTLFAVNYLVVRFVFKHRRVDQLLEGTPTVLIEEGEVQRKALAKEMLTEAELVVVAHRQGYAGLEEIRRCVIEPGGVFFIEPKRPRTDEQILGRLERITRQLEEVQRRLPV